MINRRISFRGTARISLDSLSFTEVRSPQDGIDVDSPHWFKDLVAIEGCKRGGERNNISALVCVKQLQEALSEANLQPDVLMKRPSNGYFPALRFYKRDSLRVLQGHDWGLAGRDLLPVQDRWWNVRLYVEGIPPPLEHYSSPKDAPSGEVFRMIRMCQLHQRPDEEQWWWRGISNTITKDVKQLLGKEVIMKEVDRSLHVPGFWLPVKLGALHRLLGLRCDEELAQYVKSLNETWEPVLYCLGKDVWAVDDATVEYLQLRAPKASDEDRKEITTGMKSGLLFPYVVDQLTRSQLLTCLLNIPVLIPSVQTFFSNLTYLEPCAMVMKGLLDPRPKYSIRKSFSAAFRRPPELYVEEAESKFGLYRTLEANEAFNCSYLQLWLYSMRNFPEMTRITVKKEAKEPRRYANEPNAWLWYDFAAFAARLGFSTTKMSEILSTNPGMVYARKILLDARPQDRYHFDDGQLELYTRQISEMLASARKLPSLHNQVTVSQAHTEARNRRCGRPHEHSHAVDKELLFLPTIRDSLGDVDHVNSFFVKRDFIVSFFGRHWSSSWHPLPQQDEAMPPVDSVDDLDDTLTRTLETVEVNRKRERKKILSQNKVLGRLHD
ncbi:hypothetical protein K469DRAFT_376153 [Zopfia rhizophila CBS 207.26]|uniref:Uncharacterized protein n=1 Tax=Zopfia rhizophila CBS 207.26 TaxID=1314779 RepID=A0A6A6DD28_9PEZI|nr:hypothetical protein K469DRAFT_376153 [Zopfia rhizophila CBS 207.26]